MPQQSPDGLPRRQAPAARRAGAGLATALRALASLAALVALLAGLPVLLWWGTAIVAPSGIQALGNLLSTQDSGQVFLLGLAVAGWTGWALFAVSVLVEIPAQLRGRTAPQLRLLIGQRAAAVLVGAVLLALPTGTALAASAAPASAHTAVNAAAPASVQDQAPKSAHETDVQQQATHTVRTARPAESLWSIAQVRLGDGNRWEEIAALNEGHAMANGHTFHADAPIQPGWILVLPADASPTAHTTSGTETHSAGSKSPGAEYTVESGDSLSQIAKDELGDVSQYPAIFELNKGETQPGGSHFTDPDKIFPGQHLTLPAPSTAADDNGTGTGRPDNHNTPSAQESDTKQPDEAPPPATPHTPAPNTSTTPSATPSTKPTENGAGSGRPSPSTTPSAQPSQSAPSAQTDAPATATPPQETSPEQSDDSTHQVALAAGIGALLAASLVGALGVKRILQQRRRRAGETIAIDPDPTQLEQVLNTSAEPTGVALLDTALRTLASHTDPATGQDLPVIRGARVTGRTVQLLPDSPAAEPPPPFTASEEPGTWTLDPKSALLHADTAREVPAPYPGLLTLGATHDGDLLLTDLLHTKVVLLDGNPDDVLAVARAMALEAGTSGWTDHTEIVTVGLGARLATLLPKGRVRTMPHIQSVVADLGALLVEVHQRTGTENAPQPLPWILICTGDIGTEQAWQLADALSAARNLPIAAVLPANDATRQAFPHAEPIPTTPQIPVTLPHLSSVPVQLQRLAEEQYRQFIHALEVAEEPAQPATGAWKLAKDHNQAATPAGPHPAFLNHLSNDDGTDPGNPFPALLASVSPQRTRQSGHSEAKPGTPAPEAGSPASGAQGDSLPPTTTATGPSKSAADPRQETPSQPGQLSDEADTTAATRNSDENPGDANAPTISVLGPLRVSGISGSGHGPKVAALATLIHLRPGRSAEALCTAMDPISPWSTRTLQSRLSEIRSRLGNNTDGQAYLPRPKNGYAFHPAVRSDWDTFQELASRALTAGPDSGIPDLENALGLVRGKPFEDQDYSWADSVQQKMLSRIVDAAHTLASWHAHSDTPDMDAARHAVLRGLDIEETAEVLYRDWMHIEWAVGNTTGVRKAIARVQQVARTYDISLEPATEQLITLVLSGSPSPAATATHA
ncbi:LysM peptidoglycan-binding domain-containing protein [Streptomyces sp. NPDC005525]|uniref:LysM peptidoglycan-binding domain-containing protein n=1 Tax=Streptomyces sp. NPDC005525 TaxID=3364720 RepID=UPI0036A80D81